MQLLIFTFYGRRQLELPPAVVLLLLFRSSFFILFLPPNLRGRLADRHQTLPHVRWWPRFMKFGQRFLRPLPPGIWQPKKHEILARFQTSLQLDRECLWNTTRHCRSENGVANYGHSQTGKLNLVYFGPQTDKNRTGVLTHLPAIVQRTGINNSVAFARWQQRAAINATHSSCFCCCCCCYLRRHLASGEGIVWLGVRHAVCVSAALVSAARVMRCIQCCLSVVVVIVTRLCGSLLCLCRCRSPFSLIQLKLWIILTFALSDLKNCDFRRLLPWNQLGDHQKRGVLCLF